MAAGAAAGVGDTAKQVVLDAYLGMKGLISRRYGVVDAEVVGVESEPEEPLRRQLLAKQLAKTGAGDDLQLQTAARELLELIAEQAPTAAAAVGMKLTRAKVGGDLEVTDLTVSNGSGFEGTDIDVTGSVRYTGGRIGGPGGPFDRARVTPSPSASPISGDGAGASVVGDRDVVVEQGTLGAGPTMRLTDTSVGGDFSVSVTNRFEFGVVSDAALMTEASRYVSQVREFIVPVDGLKDREGELDVLAGFCRGDRSYLWIRAEPWAGKSALLSWFALAPPASVTVVSFFVTGRLADQNDHTAFTAALFDQLAVLLPDLRALIAAAVLNRDGLRNDLLTTAARREAERGGGWYWSWTAWMRRPAGRRSSRCCRLARIRICGSSSPAATARGCLSRPNTPCWSRGPTC